MSKNTFKKFIKLKIKSVALKYLNAEKETKSKVKDIQYKKLKLQKYMTSSLFNNYEVEILCKARSRNLDVKSNFKTKYTVNNDITKLRCKIETCLEVEDQQHIFKCKPILNKLDKNSSIENISYDSMFSTPKKQIKLTKVLIKLLDLRESTLSSQTSTNV